MDPATLSLAKPMIEKIVSKLIVPKLEKLAAKVSLEYNKILIPKGEHFSEYLHRTYKKYSTANTLAIRNNQRALKDIYVPLTLNVLKKDVNAKVRIEEYPIQLVEEYRQILIVDTAGMGKSTLSKRMFLDVIDRGLGIPIFIELRRLSKDRSILHEVHNQINSLSKTFDVELMLALLQTGGFIFFLDGYDEIALSERTSVTKDIQDFISKANDNMYILTSRPENALSSFGDFQRFVIEPLKKKEAYDLLRKYDVNGDTSRSLIEKLKSREYRMMEEFLRNPLLVSLLFTAYDYKQTIPLKKHIFYRQVYDAHFDSHDLSKGDGFTHEKKSKLDIDDFDKVLRFIGFECLKRHKIEFDKDELLDIINKSKSFCIGVEFTASHLLDDLLKSVPLFCEDGIYYKWTHKSLQEYFAAQFIYKDIKEAQDSILSTIYYSHNIEKYYNMLDLYYDIDTFGFRKNILLPLLKDYGSYLGNDMMSEAKLVYLGLSYCRSCYVVVFDTDEPFPNIINRFEKELSTSVKEAHKASFRGNSILCVIEPDFNGHKKRLLFEILINKRRDLFIRHVSSFKRHESDWVSKLEKNVFHSLIYNQINKEYNDDFFDELNFYIANLGGYGAYYIQRKDCIKEINLIEREIKYKENPSALLQGL